MLNIFTQNTTDLCLSLSVCLSVFLSIIRVLGTLTGEKRRVVTFQVIQTFFIRKKYKIFDEFSHSVQKKSLQNKMFVIIKLMIMFLLYYRFLTVHMY